VRDVGGQPPPGELGPVQLVGHAVEGRDQFAQFAGRAHSGAGRAVLAARVRAASARRASGRASRWLTYQFAAA
jgi:hypothetical protein